MCSHRGFSSWTEHLRRPPCRRNSPWSGKYNILCWWKHVKWDGESRATYYPCYFKMGKYAGLSFEGAPYILWFHFSDRYSQGLAVSVSNTDFMERVCHLTNKIYREMLYTRHETTRMTYITIHGLDHVQFSAFSCNPLYRIVLSLDLLSWIPMEGRIPCSFTSFITTPELSGPLYISPYDYHTQITEYSLRSLWALFSLHRISF